MNLYKHQAIQFVVMIIVGMLFNPMNVLAYRVSDLFISLTLFYGGVLMASNMMWAHEIIHYLSMGHFNKYVFIVGIALSILTTFLLLKEQLFVNDAQWLRRMIPHHSTALTTTHNIYNKTKNVVVKQLAGNIIKAQEDEISLMKSLL